MRDQRGRERGRKSHTCTQIHTRSHLRRRHLPELGSRQTFDPLEAFPAPPRAQAHSQTLIRPYDDVIPCDFPVWRRGCGFWLLARETPGFRLVARRCFVRVASDCGMGELYTSDSSFASRVCRWEALISFHNERGRYRWYFSGSGEIISNNYIEMVYQQNILSRDTVPYKVKNGKDHSSGLGEWFFAVFRLTLTCSTMTEE